ncbi:porin family protein [Paracoccus caeni]|uniref:Porin family protein n=1 Tax=Paracoccus caeni TaxID=657651 RepID=A0A934SH42_9RHOB|nr:outer membrane beta-barrel protein [Paracoccus caeni]MBK4214393.1 porin family protein [Paracoccus caeni]
MRVRTLFAASTAAILGVAGGAVAGGYTAPVEQPLVVAPPAPVETYNWTGGYVGLGLGGVFASDDRVGIATPAGNVIASPGSVDLSGMTYGIHAGYRWQFEMRGRQLVWGPELSYEASNADDSFDTGSASATSELDNLLSLRFRTGILNAAQNTMFYGTIGAARGEFNYKVSGAGMNYDDSFKDTALTVGLGVERKLNERVSLFGEWEYRHFDKKELVDANGFSTEATPEHHSLRVGVNFSF